MSKLLITKIEEFKTMLSSQPPYGDYFEGDIIKWVRYTLNELEPKEKKLFRTNILNICTIHLAENIKVINLTTLNAQRVIDELTENQVFLELNQGFKDAQLIILFRILQKELNVFNNSDKDVKEVLKGVFQFSESNIKTYFERESTKDTRKLPNLFACDWKELYKRKEKKD